MTEPQFVTMREARRLLGGCSKGFIYKLLAAGRLKSTNPFGRRRMVSVKSIQTLAAGRRGKYQPTPKPSTDATT